MRTVAVLLALAAAAVQAADIAPATVVRFNTVCGRCHEGECSGRLSFGHGAAAAAGGHMERYLGAVPAAQAAELFALLKYTKEHCRQYPLLPNAAGRWGVGELQVWRNAAAGYFVPLGVLSAGEHRLRLTLDTAAPCSLRVTDAHFDTALDTQPCGNGATPRFPVRAGAHYLHVQTDAEVLGLEVE